MASTVSHPLSVPGRGCGIILRWSRFRCPRISPPKGAAPRFSPWCRCSRPTCQQLPLECAGRNWPGKRGVEGRHPGTAGRRNPRRGCRTLYASRRERRTGHDRCPASGGAAEQCLPEPEAASETLRITREPAHSSPSVRFRQAKRPPFQPGCAATGWAGRTNAGRAGFRSPTARLCEAQALP